MRNRRADQQADVEAYLFATIGEHERTGRCAVLWRNAVRDVPEVLDELIGHARMLQREKPPGWNLAAWLNRSTYNAWLRRPMAKERW